MKKQFTQKAMSHIAKIIRALLFVMLIHSGESSTAQTGEALNFDGVDDYVSLPDTVAYGGPGWQELTIEAWINNTAGTSGPQAIVSSEGLNFVNLNTSGTGFISFYTDAGTLTFNALPVTTGWRQVSLVIKSGASALYENGILIATNPATFNYVTQATQVDIGHGADANDYFYGSIDEVRIWKRALSACEVQTYMNCQAGASRTNNVVEIFRFNQGVASQPNPTETSEYSYSSFVSHLAILNNFALTGPTSNWVAPGGVSSAVYCPDGLSEINVKGGSPLVTIPDGDHSLGILDGTNLIPLPVPSSKTYTYTIENTGISQLNITGITVVGDDSTAFVVSNVPSVIPANDVATFKITFTPPLPNRGYQAYVHITSNDCDKGDYDFLVSGRGTCTSPKTFITGNATICAGGNTLLTANAPSWAGIITSYRWTKRTVNSYITVGNDSTFPATEPGIYDLLVTNSYGCSEGSNSFNVVVSPAITTSASPATISAGASSTLNASTIIATSQTYNIALSDLVGMENACLNGTRFSSSLQAGFSWQDVGTGTVTGIQIQLSVGVNFITGSLNTQLNTLSAGAVINSPAGGNCVNQIGFVTININPDGYIVNGTNQFLATGLTDSWGLIPDNVNLSGYYARVIVNYLAPAVTGYSWSPGGMTEQSPVVSPDSTTEYTVTATANGCSATAKQVVTVTGSNPTCQITCPANINVNNDSGKCGAVVNFQATTTGNCGQLTYSPAPGSLFPVGTTTVNVNSPSTGQSCSFTVTVTDNENPAITAPANVTVDVNSANCSATGVSLGNPITHDNCGVQPATNDAPSVYPLGTTTVTWTVNDVHDNSVTAKQTVTVSTTLSAGLSAGSIGCNGNTATLTVNAGGGTGPYKYSLNGVGAYQSSNIFTVPAGTYTVKVMDAHGCTKTTGSKTIGQSSSITATASAGKINCYGSTTTLTVKASGGSGTLKYSMNGRAYQSSNIFTVSAGTYTVTIKDANGCKGVITKAITQPAVLTVSLSYKTNVSCYGSNDGNITVKVKGGTQPYAYKKNTASSYQSSCTFNHLSPATYSITVKDLNGCTAIVTGIRITQPSTALELALIKKTDVSCLNGSNGSIKVKASGGTGPYKYSLNNGSYRTSGTFSSLRAGTYKVDAKDANGCVTSVSVVIKNGTGSCNLSINAIASGNAIAAEPVIEDELSLEAKVLPNPSETDFTLQVKGNSTDPVEIKVFNMLGQPVHQETGPANQSYRFGQGFVAGVYIVEILQGRMVKNIKVVKN